LKEFQERDVSDKEIISLMIDGKSLAKQQIIIALGITMEGESWHWALFRVQVKIVVR